MAEKKRFRWLQNEYALLSIIIVAVLLLMGVLNPVRFFRIGNLQSMAFQLPELGLLSLGMMVIMLTGGINLSIIATANLSGILAALVITNLAPAETFAGSGVGVALLAVLVGLVAGAIVGLANGALVAYVGVSPILATLGMMTLLSGVTIVMTKGYVISGFPPAFQFIGNGTILGVPFPLLIFALVALLVGIVMERTPHGLEVYMLGTNETATRCAAVNAPAVLIKSYVISGLLSAVAAMIMISRFNSAKSDYGESYLLVTVLAAVLGGTSVYGGFGKVAGLTLALVILQIVSSGLNLLQVNAFLTRAIWGMILAAVMIGQYYRVKASARVR
jgi:ribose/xylose/arabinose/galactoside ABC-type transport system permease subunit